MPLQFYSLTVLELSSFRVNLPYFQNPYSAETKYLCILDDLYFFLLFSYKEFREEGMSVLFYNTLYTYIFSAQSGGTRGTPWPYLFHFGFGAP